MEPNLLFFVAIVALVVILAVALFSKQFKAILNRKGLEISGVNPDEKDNIEVSDIKNNSEVSVDSKDNQNVQIKNVDSSKIEINKRTPPQG